MNAVIAGGGSGAVASSAHAGCERFRLTDPLLTGRSRRALADTLGASDDAGSIPTARWVRAMAFERLVHDQAFVSELLTRAVGLLGLERPAAVRVRRAEDAVTSTAAQLADAHLKAKFAGEATMLFGLRLPFWGLEGEAGATDVRPDFAIVCPRPGDSGTVAGSWLVMGDAKDYERVRSRIDDGRMLKGFLQVALGAISAEAWSELPDGMEVHRFGALAVPRNAYLRPEAVVEDLTDHRVEVRSRAAERLEARRRLGGRQLADDELTAHVDHLDATYDPTTCATCSLFRFCRGRLRDSRDPGAVLVELGIPQAHRPALLGLVDGSGVAPSPGTPTSLSCAVEATVAGLPGTTDRRRVDPIGLPGAINVLVVKSDSASLGVHGVAVQRLDGTGEEPWDFRIFERTNATQTRHDMMALIGAQVRAVLVAGQGPVHLVVPDQPTADLLVSMADSLAGVELSRLRWQRDLDEGREPLTFDGDPATMPQALDDDARTGVSLMLDDDRGRAFSLRQPIVDARRVLATHVVPGGPTVDAGRLDYLVTWAEAASPLDHRIVSDDVAERWHTPGARLSNRASDEIHDAGRPNRGDPDRYRELVTDALEYRVDVLLRAERLLDEVPMSRLRDAHRTLEHDAQVIWGRRLALEASDLVRFSRTYPYWRNAQVEMLEADRKCREQLATLVDGQVARDRAADAGCREVAAATITSVAPLRLRLASRRIGDGTKIVLLHSEHGAAVEGDAVDLTVLKGSFKLGQLSIGRLERDDEQRLDLAWTPTLAPAAVSVGDVLVVADTDWFASAHRSGHELAVARPRLDSLAAPTAECTPTSYATDPTGHRWCCRPHTEAEAETSDWFAERRAKGELNPQVWPPVVDEERFDLDPGTDVTRAIDPGPPPATLTTDDLD